MYQCCMKAQKLSIFPQKISLLVHKHEIQIAC